MREMREIVRGEREPSRAFVVAATDEPLRLELHDPVQFAEALVAPPAPSPALQRAFARAQELLRS
jgi:uncharacterized protein (DUF1778 family)